MRDNQKAAATGGPSYRATDSGKGDVNRSRNKRKLDLGYDLIMLADKYGHDSPEYKAGLKAWRDAQS
jgi:hypothetical protein